MTGKGGEEEEEEEEKDVKIYMFDMIFYKLPV